MCAHNRTPSLKYVSIAVTNPCIVKHPSVAASSLFESHFPSLLRTSIQVLIQGQLQVALPPHGSHDKKTIGDCFFPASSAPILDNPPSQTGTPCENLLFICCPHQIIQSTNINMKV